MFEEYDPKTTKFDELICEVRATVQGRARASGEWHGEVAVGSAPLARPSTCEVGDARAEIFWSKRQLLRVDVLRVGPGSQGPFGQWPLLRIQPLRRVLLPVAEGDIGLALCGLDPSAGCPAWRVSASHQNAVTRSAITAGSSASNSLTVISGTPTWRSVATSRACSSWPGS